MEQGSKIPPGSDQVQGVLPRGDFTFTSPFEETGKDTASAQPATSKAQRENNGQQRNIFSFGSGDNTEGPADTKQTPGPEELPDEPDESGDKQQPKKKNRRRRKKRSSQAAAQLEEGNDEAMGALRGKEPSKNDEEGEDSRGRLGSPGTLPTQPAFTRPPSPMRLHPHHPLASQEPKVTEQEAAVKNTQLTADQITELKWDQVSLKKLEKESAQKILELEENNFERGNQMQRLVEQVMDANRKRSEAEKQLKEEQEARIHDHERSCETQETLNLFKKRMKEITSTIKDLQAAKGQLEEEKAALQKEVIETQNSLKAREGPRQGTKSMRDELEETHQNYKRRELQKEKKMASLRKEKKDLGQQLKDALARLGDGEKEAELARSVKEWSPTRSLSEELSETADGDDAKPETADAVTQTEVGSSGLEQVPYMTTTGVQTQFQEMVTASTQTDVADTTKEAETQTDQTGILLQAKELATKGTQTDVEIEKMATVATQNDTSNPTKEAETQTEQIEIPLQAKDLVNKGTQTDVEVEQMTTVAAQPEMPKATTKEAMIQTEQIKIPLKPKKMATKGTQTQDESPAPPVKSTDSSMTAESQTTTTTDEQEIPANQFPDSANIEALKKDKTTPKSTAHRLGLFALGLGSMVPVAATTMLLLHSSRGPGDFRGRSWGLEMDVRGTIGYGNRFGPYGVEY